MRYAIVSKNEKMPDHVKGAELITYDPIEGTKETHKIKPYVPFFPGVNTVLTAKKLGADYLVTSRELKAKRLLGWFGIENTVEKQGISIDRIIEKLGPGYKPKPKKTGGLTPEFSY